MIEITLNELDLELEVAGLPDYVLSLDGSSGTTDIQGPIDFGGLEVDGLQNYGYIDLDLIGFPYIISAYDIAVKHGFIGNEVEWLASLKGADGELGQAGKDGVAAAILAAQNAQGSASAAAGFAQDAYVYSGVSGQHAQASQELYLETKVLRDQTNAYATATATIKQETEAYLTDTIQYAAASQASRVAAETAQSKAEIAETKAATSMSSAAGSAASASENAIMAVEARNQAGDYAAAALLSETSANSSADSARSEADAARKAQLIATAARDEAGLIAQGVIVDVDKVRGYVTDAEAFAEASRQSSISANTAKTNAQTAEANAVIARNQAVQARIDAQGYASSASDSYNLTVTARNQAQTAATAAVTARNEAEVFADTSGTIYSALASRVETVEVKTAIAEGKVEVYSEVVLETANKVDAVWGVRVGSGNRVTGIKLTADGTSTSFDIDSDFFRVWNGSTSVPILEVSGGQVYINGNKVRTESIVPNAVSDSVATTGDYNGGYGHSGGGAEVCRLSITGTGRRVLITGMYRGKQTSGPGTINATASLFQNGVFVKGAGTASASGYFFSQTFMHSVLIPNGEVYTFVIFDTVGAGAGIAFYDYGISAINLKV